MFIYATRFDLELIVLSSLLSPESCFPGAAFTRFQTLRLQRIFPEVLAEQLISYGSCQFPTLGFVVERFKAIQAFVPETFHRIKGMTIGVVFGMELKAQEYNQDTTICHLDVHICFLLLLLPFSPSHFSFQNLLCDPKLLYQFFFFLISL